MQFLKILFWIFCFTVCVADGQEIDIRLKKMAETEGYGYKTANLFELGRILPEMELPLSQWNIQLEIPAFYAISSDQIVQFLKKNGLDIEQDWDKLVCSVSAEEQSDMVVHKQISARFAALLQSLQKKIKTIFNCGAFPFSIVNTDFLDFIQSASSFIVRSSGMEDKIGLTNAGGNVSVKHISPAPPELLSAMGEVVASYFSEKSISQRLLAEDPQIYCLPMISILIQKMVTDTVRPIEAVVHTTEQSGPTPGLVSINCGYDVVDSKGRSDLYYYDPSGRGHAILAKGIDHLERNCPKAIAILGAAIENHYKRAMDIELLTTSNEEGAYTIHLVQARPINRPAPRENPNYLFPIISEQVAYGETIVASGSYVRTITRPEQLIIARTLKEAEEQYLFHSPDKEAVQAIIIRSEAEPNSHEAMTFACCGKLVMLIQDLEKLNLILGWGGPFYLDAQQGVIVKKGEAELLYPGFITHPMSERVSIETLGDESSFPFEILESQSQCDISSLFKQLKQAEEKEAINSLSSLLFHLQSEFAYLQTIEKTIASEDALQKIEVLYLFAKQKALDCVAFLKNPANDLRRLAAIKPIEALFAQNDDPTLENGFSLQSILEKLHFRTALLKKLSPQSIEQIGSDLPLLDALCEGSEIAMTLDLKKKWLDFISTLPGSELNLLADLIHRLSELNAFSAWMHIVFAKSNSFHVLYAEYLEAIPFLKELQDQQNQLLSIFISDWGKPDKFDLLMNRLHLEALLSEEFKQIFCQTGRLKTILALSFMSHFIDKFDDQFIKTLLRSADYPSTEKKVCHFKKVVQAYFSLLKAWEPLSTLTQDARSWAFADFLDDIKNDVPILFSMFDFEKLDLPDLLDMASSIPEELFEELPQSTKELIHNRYASASLKEGSLILVKERFEQSDSFASYIKKMDQGIEATDSLKGQELFPPPNFSVSSEIFVNIAKKQQKVNFEGYTLAAFFTLIHQNINSILTNLAMQAGLDQFQRPPLLQVIESKIRKLGFLVDESGQTKSPSLIGVKCAKEAIHLIYNLPLKLHGVTYEIKYHRPAQEVELKMNLVSIDNDLPTLAGLFEIGASFLGAKNVSTAPFERDMSISCTFNSSSQIERLDLFLQCMHELTSSKFKELNQNLDTPYTDCFSSLINQEKFKILLEDL